MFARKTIFASLLGLGLLLSIIPSATVAQTPVEMSATSPEQIGQFRRIEQPLGLKASVTLGGLALIGLELWWFLKPS